MRFNLKCNSICCCNKFHLLLNLELVQRSIVVLVQFCHCLEILILWVSASNWTSLSSFCTNQHRSPKAKCFKYVLCRNIQLPLTSIFLQYAGSVYIFFSSVLFTSFLYRTEFFSFFNRHRHPFVRVCCSIGSFENVR